MPKLSVLAVFIQKQSVIASVSGANGLSLLDTANACPSVGFELVSVYLSPRSLTVKQIEDQIDELASQKREKPFSMGVELACGFYFKRWKIQLLSLAILKSSRKVWLEFFYARTNEEYQCWYMVENVLKIGP